MLAFKLVTRTKYVKSPFPGIAFRAVSAIEENFRKENETIFCGNLPTKLK